MYQDPQQRQCESHCKKITPALAERGGVPFVDGSALFSLGGEHGLDLLPVFGVQLLGLAREEVLDHAQMDAGLVVDLIVDDAQLFLQLAQFLIVH